jgi:hypothetical protein
MELGGLYIGSAIMDLTLAEVRHEGRVFNYFDA